MRVWLILALLLSFPFVIAVTTQRAGPPGIPTNSDDTPDPQGKVYVGDGTYTLTRGDMVVASNGLHLQFDDIRDSQQPWGTHTYASFTLTDEKGNAVLPIGKFIEGTKADWLPSNLNAVGLSAYIVEWNKDKPAVTIRVFSGQIWSITQGWSLIGVPARPLCDDCKDYTPEILYSDCNPKEDLVFWRWDAKIQQYEKSGPRPNEAAWTHATKTCKIVFAGQPATMKGHVLEKGWNLITGDSQEVRLAEDVFKNCVVTGGPWVYDLSWGDGGRFREETMIGMYTGYAVEVAESCTVNT